MNPRVLVDGQAIDQLPVDDRGLAYGDGLFETLWVSAGQPRLWPLHLARLALGAQRLDLPLPASELLQQEIYRISADLPQAVVRLSLTRGSGPRGYAPPAQVRVRRVLSAGPPPPPAPATGLRLRWCQMRWGLQSYLAGIKHLNRLEQVLARAEWTDPGIHEGLMLDQQGRVISATAANLFAIIDGRCLTPALEDCGVAGVARQWLLQHFAEIEVAPLYPADLARASELCLSSSVRGVAPVSELAGRRLEPGPWTRRLQAAWATLDTSHGSD